VAGERQALVTPDETFALLPKNALSATTLTFSAIPFRCIKSVKPRSVSIYPGAGGRIDIETDTQSPCADKTRQLDFSIVAKTHGEPREWNGIMTFRSRPDGAARLDLRGIPPYPFCPRPDLFNGFSWQKYTVQRIEFDKCP
jgi:hypothetical protein